MFIFGKIVLIFLLISVNNGIKETKSLRIGRNSNNYVINNLKYPKEYLINTDWDEVYTTRVRMEELKKIFWNFEKVNGTNDTYFIKSSLNDNYICATREFIDIFELRKPISLFNIKKFNNYETIFAVCQWRFDKISKDENIYKIINREYNTPLYSPAFFWKIEINGKSYRKSFAWHGKSSEGDEFKWRVYLFV